MLTERCSAYFAGLEEKQQKVFYRLTLAKQTTWLALISGAYLILYLLDILEQSFQVLGVGF
jgi:hypothetical protein